LLVIPEPLLRAGDLSEEPAVSFDAVECRADPLGGTVGLGDDVSAAGADDPHRGFRLALRPQSFLREASDRLVAADLVEDALGVAGHTHDVVVHLGRDRAHLLGESLVAELHRPVEACVPVTL